MALSFIFKGARWAHLWCGAGGFLSAMIVMMLIYGTGIVGPAPENAIQEQNNQAIQDTEKQVKEATLSPGSPEEALHEAENLLASGNYRKAEKILSGFRRHPEIASLLETMHSPLQVEIGFQYQHPGEKPSEIFFLDSESFPGDVRLTHRDNYRLFFSISDQAYLHIFQTDEDEKVVRLFPDPVYCPAENPLRTGIRYQFPEGADDWTYLEELSGDQDEIRETVYFLASSWPSHDLDEAYAEVYKATTKAARDKAFRHLSESIMSRKNLKMNGIFYQEFTFIHGR